MSNHQTDDHSTFTRLGALSRSQGGEMGCFVDRWSWKASNDGATAPPALWEKEGTVEYIGGEGGAPLVPGHVHIVDMVVEAGGLVLHAWGLWAADLEQWQRPRRHFQRTRPRCRKGCQP